ncbi:MAG: guanylate kinase [Bacilli bacterium]
MKKGIIVVLSGPSGVGKGTVRSYLMQDKSLNLRFSVSMTTRDKRNGEVDGVDYFFVSQDTFDDAIKNGKLLEYTRFVGHSYGTPKDHVEMLREQGFNVLLEIETEGAHNVMKHYTHDDYVSIFLTCCSLDELEKRIRGRRSEPDEVVKQRLAKAKQELTLENDYDFVVQNDYPERAANEIGQIIKNHIK